MIRKTTLAALPAIAIALTLFANVDSASAKGGMGGPKGKPMGMGREHRGDHFRKDFRHDFRYNRYWDRFSFGYPCYGCVEAPVCGCEVVAQPVVAEPVVVEAPVCTTCEPVVTVGDSYGRYFGFRHDRREFRHGERLERGGRMGFGKKK